MATPDSLLTEALDAIQDSSDEKSLESLRVHYIGKKGEVTAQLKALGQLPADERQEERKTRGTKEGRKKKKIKR